MSTPVVPLARVLVVENDPELVAMLRTLLTEESYAVESALDGHRALHLGLTCDVRSHCVSEVTEVEGRMIDG
ncbi:MAG: hypothetical protein ACRDQ5_28150 [Sciscionella sp.]